MKKDKFQQVVLQTAGMLAMAFIFVLTGCKPEDNDTPHLIAGSFDSPTPSAKSAFFYADIDDSESGSAADTHSIEKRLAGKIEDGDVIFNLKGIYNTQTGEFYLSAGSKFLTYQMQGTWKDEKINAKATITIKDLEAGECVVHTAAVNSLETNKKINGSVSKQQEEGLPSSWLGLWQDPKEGEDLEAFIQFAPFYYTHLVIPEEPGALCDMEMLSPQEGYKTIWYIYYEDFSGKSFVQINMKELDGNLEVSLYEGSLNQTFMGAKNYEFKPGDRVFVSTLVRP